VVRTPVSGLSQWKPESPGCPRCADPLKTRRLVQPTRRIRGINTQTQSRIAVGARLVDERAQQGAAHSVSSMARRNSESKFRSLGVDKPVGMQRWPPQPKPGCPNRSAVALRDRGPISLAAPIGQQLYKLGIVSKFGERRPTDRRIPEECFKQHGFKERDVFRRPRSNDQVVSIPAARARGVSPP